MWNGMEGIDLTDVAVKQGDFDLTSRETPCSYYWRGDQH